MIATASQAEVVTCRGCGLRIPADYVHRAPTLERFVFCADSCRQKFALAETPRLLGFLRRIAARTRGKGAAIATFALHSNRTVHHL